MFTIFIYFSSTNTCKIRSKNYIRSFNKIICTIVIFKPFIFILVKYKYRFIFINSHSYCISSTSFYRRSYCNSCIIFLIRKQFISNVSYFSNSKYSISIFNLSPISNKSVIFHCSILIPEITSSSFSYFYRAFFIIRLRNFFISVRSISFTSLTVIKMSLNNIIFRSYLSKIIIRAYSSSRSHSKLIIPKSFYIIICRIIRSITFAY